MRQRPMGSKYLAYFVAAYLVLLVYASLMPFDFHADAQQVARNRDRAFQSWPFGDDVYTSRSDVLSNFLLYVPLGAGVATLGVLAGAPPMAMTLIGLIFPSITSLAIEYLQMLSLSRVASAQDVLVNATGALAGAVAGGIVGKPTWLLAYRSFDRQVSARPATIVAGLLALMLALDALLPLLPTLRGREVVHGLLKSLRTLQTGWTVHPWHHWLVGRAGLYGVLTVLVGASSRLRGTIRWPVAAMMTMAMAMVLEAAKPFIAGRFANVANLPWAWAGSIAGAALGFAMRGRLSARAQLAVAAALLGGYIAYLELEPFSFVWDAAAAVKELPRGARWLPLYHYALGARLEDTRLFVRNLILGGALSCAWVLRRAAARRSRPTWRSVILAGAAAGVMALLLEAGQLLLPTRVASVTDVTTFALGGAGGAYLARRLFEHEVIRQWLIGPTNEERPTCPGA